jgi:hypothetical protein
MPPQPVEVSRGNISSRHGSNAEECLEVVGVVAKGVASIAKVHQPSAGEEGVPEIGLS